jgi:hypothetical protein
MVRTVPSQRALIYGNELGVCFDSDIWPWLRTKVSAFRSRDGNFG